MKLTFNEESHRAFNIIKERIARKTLLGYPNPRLALAVLVGALEIAIISTLMQFADETWHPLAFLSKQLRNN